MTSQRRFKKPRDVRQLASTQMSDEEQLRLVRLAELRKAIDGISSRKWTDKEWADWLTEMKRLRNL